MDGIDRVFAYYIPSTTGSAQAPPSKKTRASPPLGSAKSIALKVIEMSTGDEIECSNVARYEEALQVAKQVARIPEDWTVTIIENKSPEITMSCAPPSYALITPETYQALQRRRSSDLSAVRKRVANPKSVIVVVTYVHINSRRKLDRHAQTLRVENHQTRQELLDRWIMRVRNEGMEPWFGITRKMKVQETEYEWFTGSDDELVFPWYDHERITFKDPNRPSTEIGEDDEEQKGNSFGPDTGGPSGSKPSGSSGS
jgi:hypothetical protein